MDGPTGNATTHLNWNNVAIGSVFVLFDAIISITFRLGVASSLLVAATRCVIQLSVMALVLGTIFEANNPWGVAGIAALLNILGALETVFNKSKRRYSHMFPSVLFSMACSTIPVSLLGARFAMSVDPFWKAEQYIPIVGMLCGSTISGMVVAVSFVLRELQDNRDKVEMYLAFGASRLEACRPIAQEALRLALLPTVNQMSVIGLISLPGMLTGALLGGSPVDQAAKLQMIIMFMISASTALAAIISSVMALSIVVDDQHRIRIERITDQKIWIWRVRDKQLEKVGSGFTRILEVVRGLPKKIRNRPADGDNPVDERQPLLG